MRISISRSVFAFVLGIASLAIPAFASPWFVGDFRGPEAEVAIDPQMSVACRSAELCTVFAKQAGGQPKPIAPQAPPKRSDNGIPNNNWDTTRAAVAKKPDWYKHPSFGPLLRPLRSVLQSEARFSSCVDLDDTGALVLCSLSTDPDAIRGAMLLLTTMNGSCGSQPFCAYYFVPLKRIQK